MKDLRSRFAKIIDLASPGEGLHEAPVPGTHCIKFFQPDRRVKRHWRASLSIVAQGGKEIILGREVYRCDAAHYIATPLDLPVTSRLFSATPERPFLCLKIDLDSLALSEVAAQLEMGHAGEAENRLHAVFIGKASDQMLESFIIF